MPSPDVILIDGVDGSGKTRFAERLVAALSEGRDPPVLIHVDDYRRQVDWADPRGEAEVYWSDYFDLPAIDRTIALLRSEGRMVVVEGIFTLRLAEASAAALVYLEVPYEEAERRILDRDTAIGRTPDDVRHRTSMRYFPAQRRYRAQFHPMERAALLLDNSDPAIPRVRRADWSALPPELALRIATWAQLA
ncbi:MAG: AAA family ATPase [Gemmatimonadota bacterium]|nr:AAA family ATPase [Gemmatimonadota bacterium]MDH4348721.1 AAA family ATPase [Gemmatimonadota bacterium]